MGPLKFIKQCEWSYQGDPCKNHSELAFHNFDWECNPLVQKCADGQYEVVSYEPEKMEDFEARTTATTTIEPRISRIWVESSPELQDTQNKLEDNEILSLGQRLKEEMMEATKSVINNYFLQQKKEFAEMTGLSARVRFKIKSLTVFPVISLLLNLFRSFD